MSATTAIFEVVGGPESPVIDAGMPGSEDIRGGFESGMCVKVGGTYHVFPTERAGAEGHGPEFDRVMTRIGHWTSADAIHWTRQTPILKSSGTYAVSHLDNPANDRRGAIWSFNPVFDESINRWTGYYVAYTVDKEIFPNHSFGRIWRSVSEQPGPDGIGGPYQDTGILLEPGLDTQLWEGRQGVDSFFPYKVGGRWLGFYGGAMPFDDRAAYPHHSRLAWYVGLAAADQLAGPWERLPEPGNPVLSISPIFVENPLVSRLPDGTYVAIFDGGPAKLPLPEPVTLPNRIGYTLSRDGIHWTPASFLPLDEKLKVWWDTMRTPLCLIPETDGTYTMLFTAITVGKRFRPMGLVHLKLNPDALKAFWDAAPLASGSVKP